MMVKIICKIRDLIDGSFDRKYKTDTSGFIKKDSLDIKSSHAEEGSPFEPTTTKVFMRALYSLNIKYEDFAFIDMGSGKGRTLLLASNFPFKRIVGIEFSERLHLTALRNIRIYKSLNQKCFDIDSLYADAAEYKMRSENMVIYLYNPFGEILMKKVLENIRQIAIQDQVKLMVVYCNPVHSKLLDRLSVLPYRREIRLPKNLMQPIGERLLIYSNF